MEFSLLSAIRFTSLRDWFRRRTTSGQARNGEETRLLVGSLIREKGIFFVNYEIFFPGIRLLIFLDYL